MTLKRQSVRNTLEEWAIQVVVVSTILISSFTHEERMRSREWPQIRIIININNIYLGSVVLSKQLIRAISSRLCDTLHKVAHILNNSELQ